MKKIILLIFTTISLFSYDAPYDLEKFENTLNNSKLQAPLSRYNPRWSTKYGDFENFANRYFYLKDSKYMVFSVCKKSHRSELRERDEWRVSTKTKKILDATLKLLVKKSKKEFTFLQIHPNPDKPGKRYTTYINKPLLRIAWRRNYRSKKDHIWAIIRTDIDPFSKNYIKIDLGKRNKSFFHIKIEVLENHLKIYLNHTLKVDFDISYWKNISNYFKAGVYMQDNGCAKVIFDRLNMI